MISPGWQRAIGAATLVPAALALPVTAMALDQKLDENLLLPISLGAAAGIGGVAGLAMPGMFGSGMGRAGAAAIGAGIGVATSIAFDAALLFGLGDR